MLLTGRSHSEEFQLFRLGAPASAALGRFSETSETFGLAKQTQGTGGIYDVFSTDNIPLGAGTSGTIFFADDHHSHVSAELMSKLR